MEACGSAHDWARHLREQGHEMQLIAPQVEAIYEAVRWPTMRFVPNEVTC
jgi:transposase